MIMNELYMLNLWWSTFLPLKGCLLGRWWYLCHGSPWGYEISRVICLISGTEPHWKSSFLLFFLESPKPMGFARLFPWGKRIAEWRNLSKLTLVGGERDSLAPSIPSISCTSSPSHIKSTKKSIHYSNLIQLDAIWESITELQPFLIIFIIPNGQTQLTLSIC